jgi:hypothetical protein
MTWLILRLGYEELACLMSADLWSFHVDVDVDVD